MTDKTRWLGLGPWHEDNESELIDWTAQPQYKGLVEGDYYHAELRYSGRWGDPGHKGELDVVFDDDGKIAFAEFNETTMGRMSASAARSSSSSRTSMTSAAAWPMGGCWPTASNMWRTRSWKSRTWTLTMTY